MVTSEERLKILKMIQEGKISPEEGIQLMDALEDSGNQGKDKGSTAPASPAGKGARWLRVRVTDTDTGKVRVNVRLPVSVINAGLKMGARFSPEVEGLDMEQLMGFVQSGETGKIVDVIDDNDGEHVEVFIE
jgi:hypothetical protein